MFPEHPVVKHPVFFVYCGVQVLQSYAYSNCGRILGFCAVRWDLYDYRRNLLPTSSVRSSETPEKATLITRLNLEKKPSWRAGVETGSVGENCVLIFTVLGMCRSCQILLFAVECAVHTSCAVNRVRLSGVFKLWRCGKACDSHSARIVRHVNCACALSRTKSLCLSLRLQYTELQLATELSEQRLGLTDLYLAAWINPGSTHIAECYTVRIKLRRIACCLSECRVLHYWHITSSSSSPPHKHTAAEPVRGVSI